MKLLSARYHKPALAVFCLSLVAGMFFLIFWPEYDLLNLKVPALYTDELLQPEGKWLVWVRNNVLDEIISLVLIVSGLIVMFSAVEEEDEFMERLRLESFRWAVLISYIILMIAIAGFYGLGFLWVMVINIFAVLILFVCRFECLRYRLKKHTEHEK